MNGGTGKLSEVTTLTCTQTSGTAVTSYQYFKNNALLVTNLNTAVGRYSSSIQGTAALLNINDTTFGDNDTYSCSLGFDSSNDIVLQLESKYK